MQTADSMRYIAIIYVNIYRTVRYLIWWKKKGLPSTNFIQTKKKPGRMYYFRNCWDSGLISWIGTCQPCVPFGSFFTSFASIYAIAMSYMLFILSIELVVRGRVSNIHALSMSFNLVQECLRNTTGFVIFNISIVLQELNATGFCLQ